MIQFLRKSRQLLVQSAQFRKYTLYAVGEILLVVIGILIALQVNNWNQKRIEYDLSRQYHQRFIEDLELFITEVETLNRVADRRLKNIVSATGMLEKKRITPEDESTFYDAVQYFYRYNYSNPDLPTLQEMKSNGELSLIYDVELRNQLIEFEYNVASANNIYRSIGDAITQKLPVYDKYIRTYVDTINYRLSFDYEFKKMASDNEYINHFSRLGQQWRASAFFSNALKVQAMELRDRFKEEINQLH